MGGQKVNEVIFNIERIRSGWFDAGFSVGGRTVFISASNVWGSDCPKLFLEALCRIAENKGSRYAVFDEEPGTYIVYMERNDRLALEIFYSRLCRDKWEGAYLTGDISVKELQRHIPFEERLFSVCDVDPDAFLSSVVESFSDYLSDRGTDIYKRNWGCFPAEELERLKKAQSRIAPGGFPGVLGGFSGGVIKARCTSGNG